jgi:hypothetical protein
MTTDATRPSDSEAASDRFFGPRPGPSGEVRAVRPISARTSAERRLRLALAADAVASAVALAVGLALLDPLVRLLGVEPAAAFAGAGVIAAWVVATGTLARADRAGLRRWAPWVAAGNGAWVLATAAAHATGAVETGAWWITVPAAAVVAELAGLQAWFWRRLDCQPSPPLSTAAA